MQVNDKFLNATANNLTAVRLVLASSVIYSHCCYLTNGGLEQDGVSSALGATVATYAVDGFFFLSGFLVYPSLLRLKSPILFALARLTRLWPGLALSVLLTVAFGYFCTSEKSINYLSGQTASYIGGNLSFLRAHYTLTGVTCGTGPCNINGSLWTLPFEVRCYALLTALGALGLASRSGVMRLLVGATFVLALGWDLPFVHNAFAGHLRAGVMLQADLFQRLWTLFALGALAYIERKRIVLSWWVLLALLVAQLLSVRLGLITALQTRALLVGYGVLCFGFLTASKRAVSAGWPDYSYGTYILAFPVMVAIAALTPARGPYVLSLETLVCTLLLAAVSWHWVERPALDAFKRFRRRQSITAFA